MADVLNRVFSLRQAGQTEEAFTLYGQILSHIVFSLQNFELDLYTEKRLSAIARRSVGTGPLLDGCPWLSEVQRATDNFRLT